VQEARGKIAELGRPVAWHLVGHLQTNRPARRSSCSSVIHSVDRIDLARELDRRARARGRPVDVLVQINVGQEPSKGGWPPEAVETGGGGADGARRLRLRGLMAIPPPSSVPRMRAGRSARCASSRAARPHGAVDGDER